MPIDLRTCKPGQKLVSKHGLIMTYKEYKPDEMYPHWVNYPNGLIGSRTDDGHVFEKNRLEEDEDIIFVVPLS